MGALRQDDVFTVRAIDICRDRAWVYEGCPGSFGSLPRESSDDGLVPGRLYRVLATNFDFAKGLAAAQVAGLGSENTW